MALPPRGNRAVESHIKRKRSDLRIYGKAEKLILAGEVKMPGTVEGWTPYNSDLVADSAQKADNAGAEFFFTWNVSAAGFFPCCQAGASA